MPMPRKRTHDEPHFQLSFTLDGLSEGVNALAISPDGLYLLSGCNDGQLVNWNLLTGERLQDIDCAFNGQISCITWTDTARTFLFGCADGSIHFYRWSGARGCYVYVMQEKTHADAVQCITFDPHHKRIASISKTSLQIWTISDNKILKPLFKQPPVSEYQGRTVHFCDDGASVLSTYLESHEIACYTIEPWTLKWIKQIPTRVGGSALHGQRLLISNLFNGLDLYSLPTLELKRTFTHAIAVNVILEVEIISQPQWAVLGGDDGLVRVFDMRSGNFLYSLMHGQPGHLVQTITTHQSENLLIATASSQDDNVTIKTWTLINPVPIVLDHQDDQADQERPALQLQPANLSWAQLFIMFGLVTIITNQITAYVSGLTAGWTLDDALQLVLSSAFVLSSALVSYVKNATGYLR